jgi:hypothetical protein
VNQLLFITLKPPFEVQPIKEQPDSVSVSALLFTQLAILIMGFEELLTDHIMNYFRVGFLDLRR